MRARIKGRYQLSRPRVEILVPFQVLAELKLGAAKSARPAHHALQVEIILRPFAIAWPDIAAVGHYVDIRSTLERAGALISQPDLWIAAITRDAAHDALDLRRNSARPCRRRR